MVLGRLFYYAGKILRDSGQLIDRAGLVLQGKNAFREELSRHRRVMGLFNSRPSIAQDVFIAPNASVIGAVSIGKDSAVWYGSVIRGDVSSIQIGKNTSIGENSVIHVSSESGATATEQPTIIGNNVVIEQGAIIHGCTLEDNSTVGLGSIVLDRAVVEKFAVIGAKSVLTSGIRVPSGQVWAGSPAKFVRDLSEEEKNNLAADSASRIQLSKLHKSEHDKSSKERYEERMREEFYKKPVEFISSTSSRV